MMQDGTDICPISEPHLAHVWRITYALTGEVDYQCMGVGYQPKEGNL